MFRLSLNRATVAWGLPMLLVSSGLTTSITPTLAQSSPEPRVWQDELPPPFPSPSLPSPSVASPNSRSDRLQETGDRSFFVIIPGVAKDLPNIAARVVELGFAEEEVKQRSHPRGPHVALGPFAERAEAERWHNYFRSVGIDARVYFGR
ncbi:MAG TPA: hypothetical protein DDZ80_19845 [Cyanobacteria bacterium UBA8803]|nr:hypothetical protein [Cyanobacteria bacterium UBA9273]HBL60621.1 hypothetical protein [Cyanobacteria bacterium UBA8803]